MKENKNDRRDFIIYSFTQTKYHIFFNGKNKWIVTVLLI